MTAKGKMVSLASAIAMLAGATTANAALIDGFDGSFNTSVFISVVERDGANNVLRNLLVDTGARALDVFAGTPWSTTAGQEAEILGFINSAQAGSQVLFNVAGALNQQDFSSDRYGFLTSGFSDGPGPFGYPAQDTAITKINVMIGNTMPSPWSANGTLAANSPGDWGWHGFNWGNDLGGGISPSNEVVFGAVSQLQGWRIDLTDGSPTIGELLRYQFGPLTSDLATGDISFNATVVPVPGAIWLLGSGLGLLGVWRRRG